MDNLISFGLKWTKLKKSKFSKRLAPDAILTKFSQENVMTNGVSSICEFAYITSFVINSISGYDY